MYKMEINKKINEAKLCVRKYLIEDSLDSIFLLSDIKGINDNKLISNPTHIPNQEEEEIEIAVPVNKVIKKINL